MECVLEGKKLVSVESDYVGAPKGTGMMDLKSQNVLALLVVMQKLGSEVEQGWLRESDPERLKVYLVRQKYGLMAWQHALVEEPPGLVF